LPARNTVSKSAYLIVVHMILLFMSVEGTRYTNSFRPVGVLGRHAFQHFLHDLRQFFNRVERRSAP
jgi:hypothetical protein